MKRTERNLWSAFLGEAKANRMYEAFARKAQEEGHPEVEQAFLEAAGAETEHALNHFRVLGEVRSTLENLKAVTEGEAYEFEIMYPRMIAEAEAEGHEGAVASFRLALEGEKHHLKVFLKVLKELEQKTGEKAPVRKAVERAPNTATEVMELPQIMGEATAPPRAPETAEVFQEKARIAGLSRIREVIFGMQDGLLSTAALAAAVAATDSGNRLVIIAALAAALAGMLSMAAGSFLGSKAEKEVQEAELKLEAREIEIHPAEEKAELIEIYRREGFRYEEAVEMAEHVAADKNVWLKTMAEKELGIAPEVLSSPVLDALAMGSSYIFGAIIPLIPYFILEGGPAIGISIALAVGTLFLMGVAKARLVQRNPIVSGLEMMAVGSVAAGIGYMVGVLLPSP